MRDAIGRLIRRKKRKPVTRRKRVTIKTCFEGIEYQASKIDKLSGEIETMQQLLAMLVEKQTRQHTQAMAIYMENARLRGQPIQPEEMDATPTAP